MQAPNTGAKPHGFTFRVECCGSAYGATFFSRLIRTSYFYFFGSHSVRAHPILDFETTVTLSRDHGEIAKGSDATAFYFQANRVIDSGV